MKMRNSQVQRGVIVQQMKHRWSCYNHSPSGILLGVEHDYHPNLKVFVSARCIPQEDCTPLLKTDVKLPCKSIVISSQSGSFIRQMI